jgi:hypothetical protein
MAHGIHTSWNLYKRQHPTQGIKITSGQKQCINCLNYRSIPASILRAKGEQVDDEIWGEMAIKETANKDGDLVSV